MKTKVQNHSPRSNVKLFPILLFQGLTHSLQRLVYRPQAISSDHADHIHRIIKPTCFLLVHLIFVAYYAHAATPGLPFFEDFSSDALIDKAKTTAALSTEEQAVRLAWAKRRYGVLVDPPVFDISNDLDRTEAIAFGDADGDGNLDVFAGNVGVNKLYLNTGLSEAPFANSVGIPISDDDDFTVYIALGDVDGDGDIDVVAGNSRANRLYLNNGSANPFANVNGLNISDDNDDSTLSVALGDVDGDGDIDVVAGTLGANRLYLNNGSTNPFANVHGLNISDDDDATDSIALGDMDGDGDLDVVAGNGERFRNEGGSPNRLYLNNGTESPYANVNGVNISDHDDLTESIALGDVDGDGDIDVVAGTLGANRLYLNNGSVNPFAKVISLNISDDDDFTNSIALGDVDGDGDIDVVAQNLRAKHRLYLNNGTESPFANVNGLNFPDDHDDDTESIALGDVDGDGDLDAVAGNSGANHLYLNNGSPNPFANGNGLNISDDDDSPSSIALGDVDGDRDIDVVVGNFGVNRLYLNIGSENPFVNVNGLNISDETDGTRSIALGDVDGDGDLDVVAGNFGVNRLYLNNGSTNPFANVNGLNISDDDDDTVSIALGDVDGDGDLDVVAGNRHPSFDKGGHSNRLYLNNGSTNPFANVNGLNISDDDDVTVSIALGDADGDGDLDVVAGNEDPSGFELGSHNRLYLNNGSANPFANVNGVNISDDVDETESIALGDVDGDGDLDVLAGNLIHPNRLYLNDGSASPFANINGLNISDDDDDTESIVLGDIDGDGDLDVLAGNLIHPNRLYLNDGSASPFANVNGLNISDDDDKTRSMALGDIDGDGDLDVVAGNEITILDEDGHSNRLYLNNGSENPFASVNGLNISDDKHDTDSIALGDVDGDGDLDVVAGNWFFDKGFHNRLYLNNGSEFPFTNAQGLNISDDEDETRSIALGDIDGDGDLDVVAGNLSSNFDEDGHFNRLYLNNGSANPFENVDGLNISNDKHNTYSIVLGDVDGDGDLDVVAGNSRANRLYLNNGSANPFASVNGLNISDDENSTSAIALGDVDGDGDFDVVAGNFGVNRLYLNNGSANPFASVNGLNISDDENSTSAIVLGDVDGDGDLDVVVGNGLFSLGGRNGLYLNNGSANPFANVNGLNISDDEDETRSIALEDIDGDGDLDIVAGNIDANRIYLNNSSANPFTNERGATVLSFLDDTAAIAIADINSDGLLEVITGNKVGPNYVYFLHSHLLEPSEGGYQTHLGTVVSSTIDDRQEPIISATLTPMANIPLPTSIDFYLSNNGGQKWYQVNSGEPFGFPIIGSDLRWKANLHSLSPVATPVLHAVTITGNSTATDITLSKSFISENKDVGTEIGTFDAIDIDEGDPLYSLVEGFGSDDNTAFIIEENILKANVTFDFESKQSYTIRVQVTDEGGGFLEEQFTIGISDASDPPTDISLTANVVDENLDPGTTTGVLAATDIDSEDLHIFSLPDGVADNTLFAINGTELKTNASFDFEAQNQYVIRVRVTDGGGLTFEKEFDIMVKDVNDTATIQIISSPSDPSNELEFGKNITTEIFILVDDQENANGLTQFEFLGPNGILKTFERQTAMGVTGLVSFAPNAAGEWTVTQRWMGNNDVDGATIEIPFIISKSDSVLELFFLDVIQVVGQPRTIPGRLRISNENPGKVGLSGREITITIQHPTKNTEKSFSAKTDSRGNFEFSISKDFFNEVGEWEMEAIFMGDSDLNPGNFDSDQAIIVLQKPGYAILVQGSIESKEGLAEHDNTLNFVRKTFEDAGFDTNLAAPDIKVLPHNIPNPKDALGDAIEEWAKEKMNPAPAPLYLVLINHGEVDTFHMHPDELTPGDLDGMLRTLQDGLSGVVAKEQKIIVVLGMCFSGSFIPALSGNNRVVITAAARDEFSIRGPGEEGERQGEQFVYQLFRELRKGESLLESFQTSRQAVRSLSADRTLALNSSDPAFPGEKGQHPLLDDNGDGEGSTIVHENLDGSDGAVAARIALTSPTNSVLALDVAEVNPTRFLEPIPGDEDPASVLPPDLLWAIVNENPEDIRSIWMEVKRLNIDPGVVPDSTMQHALDLSSKEPMDIEASGDSMCASRLRDGLDDANPNALVCASWPRKGVANPNPNELFREAGGYQVFTFVAANDERAEVSEPSITWIYRASGGQSPSEFNLLEPGPDGTVDYNPNTPPSSGAFSWTPSTSPAAPLSYIFQLWEDEAQSLLVYESIPLAAVHLFLPPEKVEDDKTYWWNVVTVDRDGNSRVSELRKVTILIPNAIPGDIDVIVRDKDNRLPLENAEILRKATTGNTPLVVSFDPEAKVYSMTLEPMAHTLFARALNYLDSKEQTIEIDSGINPSISFELESNAPRFQLSIASEYGSPQGEGSYRSGTSVQWSVTSPWPSDSGDNGVRWIAGNASGEVTMDEDRVVTVEWTRQVFLEAQGEFGGSVNISSGWHDEGSSAILEAIPGENYSFSHWQGDVPAGIEKVSSLVLTMDQPYSITAIFTEIDTTPKVFRPLTDRTSTENLFFSYTFLENSFVDIGGDTLNYAATLADGSALPEWLEFSAETRTFSGMPDESGTEPLTVHVEASDSSSQSVTDVFSINVQPVGNIPADNQVPVITPTHLVVPKGISVRGALSATDVDGDELTFELISPPEQGTVNFVDVHAGMFTYTANPEAEDSDSFTVRANDGKVNSNPANVTIAITSETVELELNPGWNLMGFGEDYIRPESPAIVGIIWAWDGIRFFNVDSENDAEWHIKGQFVKGHGYWCYSESGGVLTLKRPN